MDARRRLEAWGERHPRTAVAALAAADALEDETPVYAASLAFFTLLTVGPLLVIMVLAGGAVWGEDATRGQLTSGAGILLGEEDAAALQELIQNAHADGTGVAGAVAALILVVYGAASVHLALQAALRRIWDVEPDGDLPRRARKAAAAFVLLLGLAFLLLASLAMTASVARLAGGLLERLPWAGLVIATLRLAGAFAATWGLLALIYRHLPDARTGWRAARLGGGVTALLLVGGQSALSALIGGSSLATAYGSLASIVIVIVWLYYTALIFLYGAELTQVHERRTRGIQPEPGIAKRRGDKPRGSRS